MAHSRALYIYIYIYIYLAIVFFQIHETFSNEDTIVLGIVVNMLN